MATSTIHCLNCDEKDDILECKGCSNIFCIECLPNHRDKINQEVNQLQDNCDSFRETIIDQKDNTNNRYLIKFINKWEIESIEKIKQTANKCRERIINYINHYIIEIDKNLYDLFEQSKHIRKGNKVNEILLNELIQKLENLKKELDQPSNLLVKQQSRSFINKLNIIIPFNTQWKQHGVTIAGGNGRGNKLNQLSKPFNIAIDDDQTIYITDYDNHRIIQWKSNAPEGQIVAGGNGKGSQRIQLNQPTDMFLDKESNTLIIADHGNRRIMLWSHQNNTTNGQIILSDIDYRRLAMDKDGSLYVSDTQKNEVRRWKRGEINGTIVAGGNGKGNQLNQLNFPTYMFVDDDYSLYISDRDNHRVMKWMKDAIEGIIVAGGNGQGNSLAQLSSPNGVIVDQFGHIYVADWNNDRVMRWCEGNKEGSVVVGGNGEGDELYQLNGPAGLLFDIEGNLCVADLENARIQKFEID